MDAFSEHERKREKLAAELGAARARGALIRLRKSTSNLFRRRDQTGIWKIDARSCNRVLHIDKGRMSADVEGMTTY